VSRDVARGVAWPGQHVQSAVDSSSLTQPYYGCLAVCLLNEFSLTCVLCVRVTDSLTDNHHAPDSLPNYVQHLDILC